LDIRVKNKRHRITLPLKNRSKGFNWFFSFIVWFSKIQDEKDKNFILLLDEPGLNLHASAQSDLLRFIDDLSNDYQIVYTTHSPFMILPNSLNRVRTVYDDTAGTVISDAIQEKDPDTLFPLQAALGYDIAQNLFVSKNNLLVEGPADLLYLTHISAQLKASKREGLKDGVTIVPVGGLDKVVSFVSLLRGSNLKTACLLDTFNNAKGAQRLEELIKTQIIKANHVRFYDEFTGDDKAKADIEDLFDPEEYLTLYNAAFSDDVPISLDNLDAKKLTILEQIKAVKKGKRFNHYMPAHELISGGYQITFLSPRTLDRFESMFSTINQLY
jgi:predicted ATP-dependent endonuclease of OLD family